jgi:hypothetical protein
MRFSWYLIRFDSKKIMSLLSFFGVFDHFTNAVAALLVAISISAWVERGTRVITFPWAGSRTSIKFSALLVISSLAIKFGVN